jgi:L-amino acid N-acyltransferase YncA
MRRNERLRPMVESDASAMLDIYRPLVETTAVSFEEEAPSLEDYRARVRKYVSGWAGVVAEEGGLLVGFAYGSSHRERAAYRWSVETAVYVAAAARGRGVGRRLYDELLPKLADKGFCNAYAGIALPNDASVRLHLASGFEPIGTFARVGRKFGRWRDVAWFQRPLRSNPPSPAAWDPGNP